VLFLVIGFGPAIALIAFWSTFPHWFERTVVSNGGSTITITRGAVWMTPIIALLAGLGQLVALRFWYAPFLRRCAHEIGVDLCPACGYQLTGLAPETSRCPECGHRLDR
jgi:integral membrane sensor domain MASE1